MIIKIIISARALLTRLIITGIRGYQVVSRLMTRRTCRFYPTCSTYTIEALSCYGISRGLLMGLRRIIRCHPFNPGGHDPVKKIEAGHKARGCGT